MREGRIRIRLAGAAPAHRRGNSLAPLNRRAGCAPRGGPAQTKPGTNAPAGPRRNARHPHRRPHAGGAGFSPSTQQPVEPCMHVVFLQQGQTLRCAQRQQVGQPPAHPAGLVETARGHPHIVRPACASMSEHGAEQCMLGTEFVVAVRLAPADLGHQQAVVAHRVRRTWNRRAPRTQLQQAVGLVSKSSTRASTPQAAGVAGTPASRRTASGMRRSGRRDDRHRAACPDGAVRTRAGSTPPPATAPDAGENRQNIGSTHARILARPAGPMAAPATAA
jgi:hypothetical protein